MTNYQIEMPFMVLHLLLVVESLTLVMTLMMLQQRLRDLIKLTIAEVAEPKEWLEILKKTRVLLDGAPEVESQKDRKLRREVKKRTKHH
jgi:hypothetical protein